MVYVMVYTTYIAQGDTDMTNAEWTKADEQAYQEIIVKAMRAVHSLPIHPDSGNYAGDVLSAEQWYRMRDELTAYNPRRVLIQRENIVPSVAEPVAGFGEIWKVVVDADDATIARLWRKAQGR